MYMARWILVWLIRFYQMLISPVLQAFLGPASRCRYTPSCSQYAREALQLHGASIGSFLAAKRLCRCHPWAAFGDDPVPAHFSIGKLVNSGTK
jgi:uncharacterized protein